jgi:membrane associated rhomboid family serine protease
VAAQNTFRRSLAITTGFIALLWGLHLFGYLTGTDLHSAGVYPRYLPGMAGILSAPLIHGSWPHLVGNSLPLLLLGSMLIYGYPRSRWFALAGIWLLSGVGVWLFARGSYHFGASGLTHGMFFYLFVGGILRRDKRSAAILMVAFYMYGGMLLTIFPRDPSVSFESHLFGAIAGALFAWLFRKWDPKPQRRLYSWERRTASGDVVLADDEDEAEDSLIADQWREDQDKTPPR